MKRHKRKVSPTQARIQSLKNALELSDLHGPQATEKMETELRWLQMTPRQKRQAFGRLLVDTVQKKIEPTATQS